MLACAEFRAPISGAAVPPGTRISGGDPILEQRGVESGRVVQRFRLSASKIYQIRVISYYFQPTLELWDDYGFIAASTELSPEHDGRATVYVAEIVFHPGADGEYFVSTNNADRSHTAGRHSVYVYQYGIERGGGGRFDYLVDAPAVVPDIPSDPSPSPLQPDNRPTPQPTPSGACRCPPGFVHYYGTVCIGENAPIEAGCE